MNRRQEINKLIRTYIDVNQYEDYTDYKAFITGIDNHCKDFTVSLISARIEELETELNNEDSDYSEFSARTRIDELKKLIE